MRMYDEPEAIEVVEPEACPVTLPVVVSRIDSPCSSDDHVLHIPPRQPLVRLHNQRYKPCNHGATLHVLTTAELRFSYGDAPCRGSAAKLVRAPLYIHGGYHPTTSS